MLPILSAKMQRKPNFSKSTERKNGHKNHASWTHSKVIPTDLHYNNNVFYHEKVRWPLSKFTDTNLWWKCKFKLEKDSAAKRESMQINAYYFD